MRLCWSLVKVWSDPYASLFLSQIWIKTGRAKAASGNYPLICFMGLALMGNKGMKSILLQY